MKKGWKTSSLGDACDMYQPKTISGKDMVEDGAYPVYGANGIIGRYNQFNHEEPQLLITCRGATCGSVNVSAPRSWVTGNAMVVRPKNGAIGMRFLEYLFRGGIDISKAITGAAQPQITRTNLAPLEVSYPAAIEEQERIVGILDEAFEGIATAKANAEKSLQNARALFESHLQSVFTQRGPGWVRTIIGDQVMLQRGFDITKDKQHEGDVPVVSSGGIRSFHDKAMVQAPGVVIGRKGTLGKVFYLEADFWPHDTTLWVRDFKGNDPRFVYYFFTGLDVKRLDSGTANPALNRNQVHPIEVDWPPVSRQGAIVATLDTLLEETRRLASLYQQKLDALEALKKSLLHQAFTGQL
jgi:type I restriction enzyme S subunit